MSNFRARDFRKVMGIRQDELASVIGLTQSNLSRYESNDIDFSEPMLEAMREKYGKEAVDPYLTDSADQIRDKNISAEKKDDLAILDLVTIVKKQNDTICQQVESTKEFMNRLSDMNERLLNLLEKVQFD